MESRSQTVFGRTANREDSQLNVDSILSLSDRQIELLKHAATTLPEDRRSDFLRGVANMVGARPSDCFDPGHQGVPRTGPPISAGAKEFLRNFGNIAGDGAMIGDVSETVCLSGRQLGQVVRATISLPSGCRDDFLRHFTVSLGGSRPRKHTFRTAVRRAHLHARFPGRCLETHLAPNRTHGTAQSPSVAAQRCEFRGSSTECLRSEKTNQQPRQGHGRHVPQVVVRHPCSSGEMDRDLSGAAIRRIRSPRGKILSSSNISAAMNPATSIR